MTNEGYRRNTFSVIMNNTNPNSSFVSLSDEWDVYEKIILANDFLGFVAFLATGTVSLLVLVYLYNVSLAKEGLLLYLYRDFVIILISLRALWSVKWVLNHLDKSTVNNFPIKLLAFCLYGGVLSLALVMNIISSLKLFIAKKMMLDPPIPGIADNESSGIWKIRLGCFALVVSFLSAMFSLGVYPKIYYGLVGQEVFDGQHLVSDILYKGILGVLMLTCLATWIATVYHERVSKQKLETMIPQTVNYFIGVALAVVGFTLLGETLQILDFSTRWNVYQILITVGEIIISFAIILKSEQLKSHSIRFLKNMVDDAFLMSIILIPILFSGLIYGLLSIIYTFSGFWTKHILVNLSSSIWLSIKQIMLFMSWKMCCCLNLYACNNYSINLLKCV